MVNLYLDDCLDAMKKLPAGSVDMVLCDLPYGTTACKWDTQLPFDELWENYRRIIKPDGAIVLTASQPFTSALVMSNPGMFKHEWIYQKTAGSNFAQVKRQPMKEHESVLVFSTGVPVYYPIMQERQGNEKGKTRKPAREKTLGNSDKGEVYGSISRDRDTRSYGLLRYPSSIQIFNNRNPVDRGLHPTQKPVALMEYLIRTYTLPGDVVLDNCMGSGTTGVACVITGRKFIGMEIDEKYYAIASNRIEEAHHRLDRFVEPPGGEEKP